MNITLCSAFRNAKSFLWRYFRQVNKLERALDERGDSLYLALGEGDSTDDTWRLLIKDALFYDAHVCDCTHGGPEYGSVVNAQRFKQLAHVGNTILEHIPEDTDIILWVEADLTVSAETLIKLIDNLSDVPMVAPMVMLKRAGYSADSFYDLWGFRKDGQQFKQRPPYFRGWPVDGLVQVDSIGSCWAMTAALARSVSFSEKDVVVGLCRDVYEKGGSVWVNTELKVTHL